jgi:hypothetical protein
VDQAGDAAPAWRGGMPWARTSATSDSTAVATRRPSSHARAFASTTASAGLPTLRERVVPLGVNDDREAAVELDQDLPAPGVSSTVPDGVADSSVPSCPSLSSGPRAGRASRQRRIRRARRPATLWGGQRDAVAYWKRATGQRLTRPSTTATTRPTSWAAPKQR